MIMGLGALFGLPIAFPLAEIPLLWLKDLPLLFSFLVYAFIVGGIYGLVWSLVLAIRKRKQFGEDIKQRLSGRKVMIIKYALLAISIACFVVVLFVDNIFLKMYFLLFTIAIVILFYLTIFIKSVETVCMLKRVSPHKLTEGD